MISRADFKEEGHNQWVLNHRAYRAVVRKVDDSIEVIIRAELSQDPNLEDWKTALATVNKFYKTLRLAGQDQE